jgi:hypothetical protein
MTTKEAREEGEGRFGHQGQEDRETSHGDTDRETKGVLEVQIQEEGRSGG